MLKFVKLQGFRARAIKEIKVDACLYENPPREFLK